MNAQTNAMKGQRMAVTYTGLLDAQRVFCMVYM